MIFGYTIINGSIEIIPEEAAVIRDIYQNYLSGMSLCSAASSAGATLVHSSIKRILTQKKYIGTDNYPPIIDIESFDNAKKELDKRARAMNRIKDTRTKKAPVIYNDFVISKPILKFEDPFEYAEYLYSLIEVK